ncbi:sugar ABC transporter substrate-binding protein [Legionella pneumophila serogroup 1]|uniref:sugar ABC transporter substrate-binding protein n=1 Tax=Legionella pneumophila TaxID=446 RepID=UPI00077084DA|nr:sugar ABC transporter substrate-binding protein [Legionella pneumophila]CZI41807.1 ABC transporter periplasmic-binding protein yphF precursor [Legionella pneumophila]HCE5345320.1 sugar ABC transporter substrate-binding protein [Legionella pneumophila]HCE5354748.1 sugar ABC transporter substrate-binding protein [Legionella pneumophila]HCE5363618.1 sugar ABC transporter substrate-binding protein [Legionella pneumophila]HCE5406684.1 sugar ABC transporter substrate-binding protein [Legionella p
MTKLASTLLCFSLLISASVFARDKYYLITHGSQDPYWTSLFQGAKKAAEELKVDLQILAPPGANDVPKQVQFIESALATYPSGIATTIPSDTAFSKSLQRANKLNIPVIAVDTRPKDKTKNPYLVFLGSDNLLAGKKLGEKALELTPSAKRALVLNPQPGHIGLEKRAYGIKTILQDKGIFFEELDVGTDPNQVQSRVKSYFKIHPETNIIFCLTSQALDPLGQMLLHPDRYDFNYQPQVYSFDKTPNTVSLIHKKLVNYVMDQQPFLMGYLSITQLVLMNRYQLNPVNINTAM